MRLTLTYNPKLKGRWLKEPIEGGATHFLPAGDAMCLCGQLLMFPVAIGSGEMEPLQAIDGEDGSLGLLENLCYECVYPSKERYEEYKRRCEELQMERQKRRRRNKFRKNRRNGLPNHPIHKSRARGTKGKESPKATFILDKRSIDERKSDSRPREAKGM